MKDHDQTLYILLHEKHDKRDRYSKCLIITLQSTPTTTYFWLRTDAKRTVHHTASHRNNGPDDDNLPSSVQSSYVLVVFVSVSVVPPPDNVGTKQPGASQDKAAIHNNNNNNNNSNDYGCERQCHHERTIKAAIVTILANRWDAIVSEWKVDATQDATSS